jgi:hypothetical protein
MISPTMSRVGMQMATDPSRPDVPGSQLRGDKVALVRPGVDAAEGRWVAAQHTLRVPSTSFAQLRQRVRTRG